MPKKKPLRNTNPYAHNKERYKTVGRRVQTGGLCRMGQHLVAAAAAVVFAGALGLTWTLLPS